MVSLPITLHHIVLYLPNQALQRAATTRTPSGPRSPSRSLRSRGETSQRLEMVWSPSVGGVGWQVALGLEGRVLLGVGGGLLLLADEGVGDGGAALADAVEEGDGVAHEDGPYDA